MSKAYRMSRLFRQDSGNTIMLPVDHGILGEIKGLEDPVEVLGRLIPHGVDGVLMNHGIRVQSEHLFYGTKTPGRILSSDTFYKDGSGPLHHDLVALPEMALQAGCDGVKVLLIWNRSAEEHMHNIKMIANFVREAERCQIPVMIEPLSIDPIDDPATKIKTLTDANRIAYELGADILKVVYPGDTEVIGQWVKKFKVPLVMLGGGLSGGIDDLLGTVQGAIAKGVRGVAIGRNVWQRSPEESQQLIHRFVDVVHGFRK
jgi:class I fructose-bisphosphate aldolase